MFYYQVGDSWYFLNEQSVDLSFTVSLIFRSIFMFFDILPSRELTYPTKQKRRKIIDSKVPAGKGYGFVPRRVRLKKSSRFENP